MAVHFVSSIVPLVFGGYNLIKANLRAAEGKYYNFSLESKLNLDRNA
jgi:hypothetical protein